MESLGRGGLDKFYGFYSGRGCSGCYAFTPHPEIAIAICIQRGDPAHEIICLSRLGFASILTPQPVVALAIRTVNGDSGNKVVVFTCGQVLIDLHRQRSVIAIT